MCERRGPARPDRLHHYARIAALTGLSVEEVADYAVRWPRYCREIAERYPDEALAIADSARGMVYFAAGEGEWRTVAEDEFVPRGEVWGETAHLVRRDTTERGFPRAASVEWVRRLLGRVEADRLAEVQARASELERGSPEGDTASP